MQRFAEVDAFPNVFQHVQTSPDLEEHPLKGKWGIEHFGNDHPIVVELGCGKGEYTTGLANRFSRKNYIGIDIKGARIWRGAKTALENKQFNVAFIRARIDQIEKLFSPEEVDEIWITFPDPQLQKPKERKRLTSPVFLKKYRTILKKDGLVHLKTDNHAFYTYTHEVIKEEGLNLIASSSDLYGDIRRSSTNIDKNSQLHAPYLTEIKTFYENLFTEKGFKICYLNFKLY